MGLNLKAINYDKLTYGTKVYCIWSKKLIGKVIYKSGDNWRNYMIQIIEILPPDYCECCKRGSKVPIEKYRNINLSQLRYKKYN